MKNINNKTINRLIKSNEFVIAIVIILVILIFGAINPAFYSTRNIFELFRTITVNLIFGCGVMMIIVNGGVDLSFMAIAIVTSYLTVQSCILLSMQGPLIIIFIIASIMGLIIGLFNSYLVSKYDIPVFIATLSVGSVIRGLVLAFIGNEYIPSTHMPISTIELSKKYIFLMRDIQGEFGLHIGIIISIGIIIITHIILNYTVIGRGVYALGGDKISAIRIGYNIKKIRYFIFGYAGLLSGIAGIIYVSQNRMADPISLQGQELSVIAAVVMGGTRITGGKGSVLSVILGVLLTQIILSNLVLIGVPSFWHRSTFGALIIAAILFQSIRENLKKEYKY